jgi:hypothetical protein
MSQGYPIFYQIARIKGGFLNEFNPNSY